MRFLDKYCEITLGRMDDVYITTVELPKYGTIVRVGATITEALVKIAESLEEVRLKAVDSSNPTAINQ